MSAMYLDASAFVKTVVREPESDRLESWLREHELHVSSAILRVEAMRAAWRHGADTADRARGALATLTFVALDDPVLRDAGDLLPGALRSLDAIHVATARSLGPDLGALVTYDRRMADAARELGLEVVSP